MNNSVDNPGPRYSTHNLTKTRDQLRDLYQKLEEMPLNEDPSKWLEEIQASARLREALELVIALLNDTLATLEKSRANKIERRRQAVRARKRQRSKKSQR